jgi:predicted ATPase
MKTSEYLKCALPSHVVHLEAAISFSPRLNIISGENGTMKTRLLRSLKEGHFESSGPLRSPSIQAINPKRNSQRQAFQAAYQQLQRQGKTLDVSLNERANEQFRDDHSAQYPSLGELFSMVFEERRKDGGDSKVHLRNITQSFNEVIRSVFPAYELVSQWNQSTGTPDLKIRKYGASLVELEQLSLGEAEALSLVCTINESRDRFDVYLIDEPEVHLNWALERGLFSFLKTFAERNSSQIIVVTHSRLVFDSEFFPLTQFLSWNEHGKIVSTRNPSQKQREQLAGDAISFLALSSPSTPTIFVEDRMHYEFFIALATAMHCELSVSECGNSPNVKSLFKAFRQSGNLEKKLFVVDGDNQGPTFSAESAIIELPYYCLENLLVHPVGIASTFGRDEKDVQQLLLDAIKESKRQIFKSPSFFEDFLDVLQPDQVTFDRLKKLDCSKIIDRVIAKVGCSRHEYIEKYVSWLISSEIRSELLPTTCWDFMTAASGR